MRMTKRSHSTTVGQMRRLLTLLILIALLVTTTVFALPAFANNPSENDISLSSIDYGSIDNEFKPGADPWDWVMVEAPYQIGVKEDFTAGQILTFWVDDSHVDLQPMALEWTNDFDMIQQVSMPQDTTPIITNPNGEGTITWNDAYGSNIDFAWECTPNRLNKVLTINELSDLPTPYQYIQDGGSPVLRLNLIFDPTSDVEIYVNGVLWDKSSKVQTFDEIEFMKAGEVLWRFAPLMYWDSDGNEGQSVATLERTGQSLYISIRVPYEWLQTAVYPVFIDADVTIDAAVGSTGFYRTLRSGIYWTSPTVGYVIYLNATYDLVYRKTADGGDNWAAAQVIVAAASCDAAMFDCWADWQTDGDAGTKIHIVYMSLDTEEIRYVYLDTSGDSVGGDDLIETCQGTGTLFALSYYYLYTALSITKTRGGNFAVAISYRDSGGTVFGSFYTSPDADTWTSKTSPFEGVLNDQILLFPANLADNQDLWAAYWDATADEISLKTFDNSNNDWTTIGEASVSGSMAEDGYRKQWDGAIRLTDGHLLLAAWSEHDTATADLKTWDITDAGTITAKTNVITDTAEYIICSTLINQDNDDWYVVYTGGTAALSLTKVFYQLSQNGGANWDGETVMQADAEDDIRGIQCGAVKAAWGGKFLPTWINDDLDDLFCNTDNGISIAAAGGGAPDAPTNFAATDNLDDTVTCTWTKSVGATKYQLYRDAAPVGAELGDVATTDDDTAVAGTISDAGNVTASDGDSTVHIVLSLAGEATSSGTVYSYTVRAGSAGGWSGDSNADNGNRSVGAITYQWQVDDGGGYDNIVGGTTDPYNEAAAPAGTISNAGTVTASDGTEAHVTLSLAAEATANGATYDYQCIVSASGASNTPQTSDNDDGYRKVGDITYQWQVDDGGGYDDIIGGTTDPYNYAGAPASTITPGNAVATDHTHTDKVALNLAGESIANGAIYDYQCVISSVGASNTPQTSDNNDGYRGHGVLTYQWRVDDGGGYDDIVGGTTEAYDYAGAPSPTITSGNTVATDGDHTDRVSLSLAGTSLNDGATYSYKCVLDATGCAQQTSGVDTGETGGGVLGYQWEVDRGFGWNNIVGATLSTYDDGAASAGTVSPGVASASNGTSVTHSTLSLAGEGINDGAISDYRCKLTAVDAANQTSGSNTGFRRPINLTYKWYRSQTDADGAPWDVVVGGTTDPFNDTSFPANGDGRWVYCEVDATDAVAQDSTHSSGFRATPVDSCPPGSNNCAPLWFVNLLSAVIALVVLIGIIACGGSGVTWVAGILIGVVAIEIVRAALL